MPEQLFVFDRDRLEPLLAGPEASISTPAFVYDLDHAARRFAELRQALPARVTVAYAVKSNPGDPLLRTFAKRGAWFDCASAGEVERVLAASPHAELVFAGPAKSYRDLQAAIDAGARVQVDGIEDVARLSAEHDRRDGPDAAPWLINVRVNPASGVSERASIIGGAGPSAFGVDEEDLAAFVHRTGNYGGVRIAGVQVFAASNELDADVLLANHATAVRIAQTLSEEHGVELDLIDIGGGLGIPYAETDPELDITALGSGLGALLDDHPWFTGDLLLEPGRWLSGPCGVYAARVVRTKVSRGVAFAMLEGGINHLLRPLMTGQSFPTMALRPTDDVDDVEVTLAGPLCTSLDRLGTGQLPADLRAGDIVVFGQSGAYAYTQAMTHFLSHPPPAQHWLAATPSDEPATAGAPGVRR
ncbi:type III PLP-dependent enzyme [soil metagenome]